MERKRSFKFSDPASNRELIGLLEKAHIEYFVDDKDETIHYRASDEELVENDLICSIRNKVFPSWQVVTCPTDWIGSYRDYMATHAIPFREELSDGELWFLIPRRYRPNSWKLRSPTKTRRLAI